MVYLCWKEWNKTIDLLLSSRRKECDEVAEELRRARIPALSYHAGLNDKERTEAQMRWIREDGCKVWARDTRPLSV